jgi:hypothetical protein
MAKTLSPLDRLRRTCKRTAIVGVVVAGIGAVVAAVYPSRDLPLTLTFSAAGLWLVGMGLFGVRKVDHVRAGPPERAQ